MKVETGKPIVVPELESELKENDRMAESMKKLDAVLEAYGTKIPWAKIQEYCNREFGLGKTAESYRKRYRLIRDRIRAQE